MPEALSFFSNVGSCPSACFSGSGPNSRSLVSDASVRYGATDSRTEKEGDASLTELERDSAIIHKPPLNGVWAWAPYTIVEACIRSS